MGCPGVPAPSSVHPSSCSRFLLPPLCTSSEVGRAGVTAGLCGGRRPLREAVPMGMFSWQMASSILGQSATSRGMTPPSPGARAVAPSRPRAPSTGSKVKPSHRPSWAGPGALGRVPPQGLRTESRLFGMPVWNSWADSVFLAGSHRPSVCGLGLHSREPGQLARGR